ncbi:hypothetical protein I4U23_028407 [Adineta vaga]|nr:hypothetical protein I4U23_028407 [Adineta vaga]
MSSPISANFRGSERNQLDLQSLFVLVCFVFIWLFIYLQTNDELSKAIFIQNSLISTWTVAYSLRVFAPASYLKFPFTFLIFRCTVTILNASSLLMMVYYEDFGLCLLLVLSLLLSKSILLAGPALSINLHWWSNFDNIINRPIYTDDYVVVCECLLLFGLIVSILQIIPWSRMIQSSTQFYMSLITVFVCVFLPQAYFFVQENPFLWLFNYILNKSHRIQLLLLWFIVSLCSLLIVNLHLRFTKNLDMKPIIVYSSGILCDTQLLTMCSVAFIVLLLLLECMKVKNVAPFGDLIRNAWNMYENEKDTGPLMVSHLFLIIGLSYPIWLADDKRRLAQFSGILSVGIGDSAASIVGSKIGIRKWPGSKRTLEGSLAGLVAQFSFTACLWYLDIIPYSQYNLLFVSLGLLFTTQLEAFSHDIDNLTLPICLFPFLYACKTY